MNLNTADQNEASSTLYDQKHVANALGVKPSTLERWRFEGRGPAFIKVGRLVRYRQSDIETWLEAQTQAHTAA